MTDALTLSEVDTLLAIAAKHGVVELSFRGLVVKRGILEPKPERSPEVESELDRIKRMPMDQQDAMLTLRRVKRDPNG